MDEPKLTKALSFTDIHWGAKGNSENHNKDCLAFIEWTCNQAKKHEVDHIIFMGDWFENRNAVNISTLNYSYIGASMLNELDIPIFFIVGNHDLYHRHTRAVYSTVMFQEFKNFTVINTPSIESRIYGDPLLCPYLFANEYPSLLQYISAKSWWGHFEFKGFIITGYNTIMPTGPDHHDFAGPEIFSGHYHKRQMVDNVTYIGNTFPTNFGDVMDVDRGILIYDHISQQKTFVNWPNCPRYIKIPLSKMIANPPEFKSTDHVRCVVDIPITYEDSAAMRSTFMEEYNLQEFTMEESYELENALENGDDASSDVAVSIDDLVVDMISSIDVPKIDNATLIKIYQQLSAE